MNMSFRTGGLQIGIMKNVCYDLFMENVCNHLFLENVCYDLFMGNVCSDLFMENVCYYLFMKTVCNDMNKSLMRGLTSRKTYSLKFITHIFHDFFMFMEYV